MSNESPSPPPLRLKPRLSPVLPKEPEKAHPSAATPSAANERAPVTDAVEAEAAPRAGAEDPGKFKLKPRALVAPPLVPSVAGLEATPIQIPPVTTAIVKPVMPAAALASPAFGKPAAPLPPGRPPMPISALPPGSVAPFVRPAAMAVSDKASNTVPAKAGLGALIALIVIALGVFGFLGYRLLHTDAAPAPVKPVKEGSLVVENPQSLPGQLVAKAEAAAAAHNSAHTESIDELLAPAAAPAPSAGVAVPEVAPAIESPPAAPVPVEVMPPPEPSAAFRAFVVNLKVTGVFQGESARAMFNGKMYRLGEVLDSGLGIVFARIDPETKHLIFEDAKGAIMSRRY